MYFVAKTRELYFVYAYYCVMQVKSMIDFAGADVHNCGCSAWICKISIRPKRSWMVYFCWYFIGLYIIF